MFFICLRVIALTLLSTACSVPQYPHEVRLTSTNPVGSIVGQDDTGDGQWDVIFFSGSEKLYTFGEGQCDNARYIPETRQWKYIPTNADRSAQMYNVQIVPNAVIMPIIKKLNHARDHQT